MIVVILVLGEAYIVYRVIKNSYLYEMNHAYNYDSTLYWTVARGILNGIRPYSGLYENKPPIIFLINTLSFYFCDDTILSNAFCFISLLFIIISPVLCLVRLYACQSEKKVLGCLVFAILLEVMISTYIMVYLHSRAGGVQVECIGSGLCGLFIWSTMMIDTEKKRKRFWIWIIVSALLISLTVETKEPFFIIAIAGACLFIDNIKGLIYKAVLPSVIGGIITVTCLEISGIWSDYWGVYLRYMLGSKIGNSESTLLLRTFNFKRIIQDFIDFDQPFAIVIVGMLFLSIIVSFIKYGINRKSIIAIFKVILCVVAGSFCVGLGGQYYDHHFAFAVPIYIALSIYVCKSLFDLKNSAFLRIISYCLIMIMCIVVFKNRHYGFGNGTDWQSQYSEIKEQANYVDALLDFYEEDRYQYIGFNGIDCFYGLTKHSPMGPCFAQDADNFYSEDTWFCQQLLDEVEQVNIVILLCVEL